MADNNIEYNLIVDIKVNISLFDAIKLRIAGEKYHKEIIEIVKTLKEKK